MSTKFESRDFYLMLDEAIDIALFDRPITPSDPIYETYSAVKDAFIECLIDLAPGLEAVTEKDVTLEEAAREYATGYLLEVMSWFDNPEFKSTFQEACKKRVKKRLTESTETDVDIDDIVATESKKLAKLSTLYMMSIFPILVETGIDLNDLENQINLEAAMTILEDLVEVASQF